MPGPMDPRTDKTARWIFLDKLRRSLLPYVYDNLDLQHLQPLRDEVEAALKPALLTDGFKSD